MVWSLVNWMYFLSMVMSINMEVKSEIMSNDTTSSFLATSWLLIHSANYLAFLTEYSVSSVRCSSTEAKYFKG